MSLLQGIILGFLQGITEFLPISSSGHLVLLNNIFGIKEGVLFSTVMFHFGSLISIFIYYFNDIYKIILGFIRFLINLVKNRRINIENGYQNFALMIIIATIPTGIMGVFFKDFFEGLYSSLLAVAIAFMITGAILFISEKFLSGHKRARNISTFDALIIGVFQGCAITPGISRSGSTIVGSLFRGLNKETATKFSLLMAIPAILGASVLDFVDVILNNSMALTLPIIVGTLVSAITGIFAIKLLVNLLKKGKLYYFSIYLWILGGVLIFLNFKG